MTPEDDQRSFLGSLIGDGRPLLALTGTALFMSGGFNIFQSFTGYLLPQDAHAIGLDAAALSKAANPQLMHFMFHDRVAFGGTLLAIGSAYWWLSEFPLKAGRNWAWWAFAISGFFGFLSFLAYLGYGYLDLWHAVATLFLLPVFLVGMFRSHRSLAAPLHIRQAWSPMPAESSRARWGRLLMQFCSLGLISAGTTIIAVGMTSVFVPQDLAYMHLSRNQLHQLSPMLIPVIAHDRAGFGGGILSVGLLVATIARNAPLTRGAVEVLGLMGLFGFGAALGVHAAIGYTDWSHLAPAYAGFFLFLIGLLLCATGRVKTGPQTIPVPDRRPAHKMPSN